MIDINKAKESFERFMSNYDMNNEKIKLKYHHTIRVMDVCRNIALSEGFNDEEVALAELIGLLHDIGRFEQIKQYDSFNDFQTADHGNLGTAMLFDDNQIRDFVKTDRYDEIIKKAVYSHNKATIPDNYTELEKLYAKIVRDADKLDILYLMVTGEIHYDISSETISDGIIDSVSNKTIVNYRDVKTVLDKVILNLAFVYDLNFAYSYEILRKEKYIDMIIDSLELNNDESKQIFRKLRELINNEINKYEEVI